MDGGSAGHVVADEAALTGFTGAFPKSLTPIFVEVDGVDVLAVAALDFVPAEAAHANERLELVSPLDCLRHLFFRFQFNHFWSPVLGFGLCPTDKGDIIRFDIIIQENNIFSAIIFRAMLCFVAVELRIKEAAEARGITTAYQLQKKMKVPPGTAARLWRGDMKMIGLDTIEALCEAIGCEPADLIIRTHSTGGRSS